MDLTYYQNFIKVVEAGSLSAAAQNLNLAQPALSVQLRQLEQNYGAKLLKLQRGVRKLQLTEAGAVFYEQAKKLCAIEEATRLELQNCTHHIAGTLKISLSPARAPLFVKTYLKPFHQANPNVNYQIYEVDVYTQVRHILDGITDFAIANAPLPEPHRFQILMSHKDRFIIVMHKTNPLVRQLKKQIPLSALYELPLCTNLGSLPLLQEHFLALGLTPRFLSVSTTRTTAVQFAEQNLGIALVPAEAGEQFSDPLVCRAVTDDNLYVSKTVYMAKDKRLSRICEKFLTFYQNTDEKVFSGNTVPE